MGIFFLNIPLFLEFCSTVSSHPKVQFPSSDGKLKKKTSRKLKFLDEILLPWFTIKNLLPGRNKDILFLLSQCAQSPRLWPAHSWSGQLCAASLGNSSEAGGVGAGLQSQGHSPSPTQEEKWLGLLSQPSDPLNVLMGGGSWKGRGAGTGKTVNALKKLIIISISISLPFKITNVAT